MGSLAPQGSGSSTGTGGGQVVDSSSDESFVTSTTYANALVVDLQTIGDSIFHISNPSGIAILYKVYATPKVSVSAPADSDDSWYNTLNDESAITDPSTYAHNKEVTIPAGGKSRESLSNKYAWSRIVIKSASGTPTVKVWHRGATPS